MAANEAKASFAAICVFAQAIATAVSASIVDTTIPIRICWHTTYKRFTLQFERIEGMRKISRRNFIQSSAAATLAAQPLFASAKRMDTKKLLLVGTQTSGTS